MKRGQLKRTLELVCSDCRIPPHSSARCLRPHHYAPTSKLKQIARPNHPWNNPEKCAVKLQQNTRNSQIIS
eukprot:4625634-Amphidinium_carterae.1